MEHLISVVKRAMEEGEQLPFSVYSSVKTQKILNVPIIKPLLILVLDGEKRLGDSSEILCNTGSFVFLSNNPNVDMRNIPSEKEYFAVLIEFEHDDFTIFAHSTQFSPKHFLGDISVGLSKVITQFIEWSAFIPKEMQSLRRQEILQYLYYLGYQDVASISHSPSTSHKIHNILSANISEDVGLTFLCEQLAMSESTLRRRLQLEGVNLQGLKDQARLGHGLHLLQTTNDAINVIANVCGYQSQSRFTQRFKQRFGLTPTELRKTKMTD